MTHLPEQPVIANPGAKLCPTCRGAGRYKYLVTIRECEMCWGIGEVDGQTGERFEGDTAAPRLRDALNTLALANEHLQKRLDRLKDAEAALNAQSMAEQVYPERYKRQRGGHGD